MKRALITGSAGQDGSYLSEFLTEKGYEVTGVDKNNGNLLDKGVVENLVSQGFDEVYNFASVSTVENPWQDPVEVIEGTGLIPLIFLEAIRLHSPHTRFFQTSSAEMFGDPQDSPQREGTPLNPRSPYGYGKMLVHLAVGGYRTQKNLFAVSGILFNHESPRRGIHFVTRKITSTLSAIRRGGEGVLELGNLDAKRDWSFAGDMVRGMWLSLQHERADDYVFASGEVHTVREFVETAARLLEINITWQGSGVEEKGFDASGKLIVSVNPVFFRPVETHIRQGDISKAKKLLNWQPEVSFGALIEMMVKAEK